MMIQSQVIPPGFEAGGGLMGTGAGLTEGLRAAGPAGTALRPPSVLTGAPSGLEASVFIFCLELFLIQGQVIPPGVEAGGRPGPDGGRTESGPSGSSGSWTFRRARSRPHKTPWERPGSRPT